MKSIRNIEASVQPSRDREYYYSDAFCVYSGEKLLADLIIYRQAKDHR